MTKTNNTEKINAIKNVIMENIGELQKLYNDNETSLNEMYDILSFAKLLNITDFEKTITG